MKRVPTALLLVALLSVAAGCASSSSRKASAQTGLLNVPSLRTDLRITKNAPCLNGHQTLSGPDAVSGFHAVTAVMCGEGTRIYPGSGQWEVYVRRVAVSSVANLQRYFEQRSVTTHPGDVCTADAVGVMIPIFVDSHGRWLIPQAPVDGCGHPLGFSGHGKGSLRVRWRVVQVRKVRLMVSTAALAAGCDMKSGRPSPRPYRSGPVFVVSPRTVHVCVYRTTPRHQWIGNFVRGVRLDRSQTRRLLSALTSGRPRSACPRQPAFAEVIASPGTTAGLELGGCYRVEGAGTANAAVVRSLLGSG